MVLRENTIKIVSTLGPASDSREMLKKLIDAGVDVFRMNFSHGKHDEKRELVKKIREVDEYIGILADIQGPKIRVGNFKDDGTYNLTISQDIKIYEKEIEGDENQFSISLPGFLKSMKKGDHFFVNDGIIKIEIMDKERDYLLGKVLSGGPISNKKGVNIPSNKLKQIRVPTEKDIKDLELIAELNPDYLAISFVSGANDVLHVKKLLENYGNSDIKLVSKIERPVALDNFDAILEVSDAIMIARGDLGD